MALTPEQERLLADRYGVKQHTPLRQRRQFWAGFLGVVGLAVATFWFSNTNYNPVSYEVVAYEVVNDWQIRIEFEVVAPAGSELSCDLQAMDSTFGIVGHKTIDLPAGDAAVSRYSASVRTSAKAVTGVVEICRQK